MIRPRLPLETVLHWDAYDPKNEAEQLKQYDQGAAFIKSVEKQASWDALAMAWESPEALPTLDEIEEPFLWLTRVSG